MNVLLFEWYAAKAEVHRIKHGVGFPEASTVFHDPLAVTVDDPDHGLLEA
jgi:uncharacterized DUF497 family protein